MKIVKKRRKFILKVFFGFVIAAIIGVLVWPPTYESEALLRIKQPKGLGSSLLGDIGGANMGAKQQMSTYAEILKSRTVVQKVIDQTQQDKEKKPLYEDFVKTITTKPFKDTEILSVSVQARTPEEAQYVANVVLDEFIGRMTGLVRKEQGKVKDFIGIRMKDAKLELEEAESLLQQYKQREKIVVPTEEGKALVEKLTAMDKMKAENNITIESLRARADGASEQLGQQKPGFVGENPVIQQLKLKLVELETELVTLQQTYTDSHPQVASRRAAIAETKNRINAEITKVVNKDASSSNVIHQGVLQTKIQTEVELSAANARKNAIDKAVADSERELLKLPARESGLIRVMRDANVAQEIYVMLAKRYEEAKIAEVMEPTDVQIIDMPELPEKPVKPKKTLTVIAMAMLGLMTGLGIAVGTEAINRTIRTPEDVEQYLGLPVLGSIPFIDDADTKQKRG